MWSDMGDIIGTDASCNVDTDGNDPDQLDCGEVNPFVIGSLAAQHVPDEKRMPGKLGHHAHVEPMGRVSAAKKILNEVIAPGHVGDHVTVKPVETFDGHRPVSIPPDRVFDRGCAHNVLVVRRPPGEFACCHQQCAAPAKGAFAETKSFLDQIGLH